MGKQRKQRCDPGEVPSPKERPKGYAERYALALASRRAPREGKQRKMGEQGEIGKFPITSHP